MTTTTDDSLVHRATGAPRTERTGVAVLYTITAFAGASLLFTVQPMVARLLLPSYGGSATVWSTSALFFQTLLLIGYLYTHLTTTRLPLRVQPWVHFAVLAVPLLVLPLALPGQSGPQGDQSPTLWLLRTLMVMIGLPFAVLSTTGPLLQKWYSWSDGPRAEDPYFMFAASNLGSFGGLLAYPLLIEPNLTLTEQRMVFSVGFVTFVVLIAACGVVVLRRSNARADQPARPARTTLSRGRLLRWTAYAFLPSCLMLAVTAHLSTDVASIPMLWVVPLATYLATFVAAFARRSRTIPGWWARAATALTLATAVTVSISGPLPIGVLVVLNIALLAVVGFVSHSLLAADRPEPEHLTTFYLVVAVGGVLGGLVNGLLAPVVFDRILEYPLTLVSIPLVLMVVPLGARPGWWANRYHPAFLGTLVLLGCATCVYLAPFPLLVRVSHRTFAVAVTLVVVAAIGWALAGWARSVSLGVLVGLVVMGATGSQGVIERERTFYGAYTVREEGSLRRLQHGTTSHGSQYLDDARRRQPTAYYAADGPVGDIFAVTRPRATGVVGLGAGTIAAYGRAGDEITFFEIDQAVVDAAEDPRLFTFLSDSAADVRVRVGDGRLLLAEEPAGAFDLLMLDAFSSDSIPIHLLTREAMEVYASRIAPGGVLGVHISNRSIDLAPVLAAAADDLGWSAAVRTGGESSLSSSSTWVALTADPARTEQISGGEGWEPLSTERVVRWTDDYSSVFTVLK